MLATRLTKLESALKITGLAVLGVGVVLGFANLRGWLRYPERVAFLQWALQSQLGMSIQEPPAQAFMERYPPPEDARPELVSHITKQVLRAEKGPVMQASFNYMHSDHSRTSYVATLGDIREWAAESAYPWLSWILMVVGFLEVLSSTGIQWWRERKI